MKDQINFLESLQFGSSIAENETKYLQQFFVDTIFWRNLSRGRYDIILGQKGCGKSALYLNLLSKPEEFQQNNIILVEAENPRGDTVFSLLNKAAKKQAYENPNVEALIESDVIDFWKMYFLVIAAAKLRDLKFKGSNFKVIQKLFEETKLLPPSGYSLDKIFNNVVHFLRQVATLEFFQPEKDAKGDFTPREMINFLLKCQECQLELLDQGYPMPETPLIDARAMLKAIQLVSHDKFYLTLIPENPDLTDKLLLFKNAPLEISVGWLKRFFPELEASQSIVNFVVGLSDVGFLMRTGEDSFQVAPIYRPALNIK